MIKDPDLLDPWPCVDCGHSFSAHGSLPRGRGEVCVCCGCSNYIPGTQEDRKL